MAREVRYLLASTVRYNLNRATKHDLAPVAQRIERLPPEQEATGSSPVGRTPS